MPAFNIQQSFQQARLFQRAGRLDEAERLYRDLLKVDSKNADVLHMLGLIARQRGQHEAAVELIRTAVKRKPNYPEAHYNLANALGDLGRTTEAIAAYRRAISQRPEFIKAHSNLGVVLYRDRQFQLALTEQIEVARIDPRFPNAHYHLANTLCGLGRLREAIVEYDRAVIDNPHSAEVFHDLGCCLGRVGQTEKAADAFKRSLALKPDNRDAYDNLSIALRLLRQLDDAIAVSRKAVSIYPEAASCYCNLGHALNDKSDYPPAHEAYSQAISLDPDLISAYQGLSQVLEKQGRTSEAIEALKSGQKRGGLASVFEFELAALGCGDVPAAPPADYMIGLFNGYADNFDQHLVKDLHYVGPQLLFDAVNAVFHPPTMDILDLGCGTGLCGELFRPLAANLTGIDLAAKMVEKARLRDVYDHVEESEVTASLRQRSRVWDLILAADVFIYVGSLDPVFEAAASALRPGGLLAFTVESTDAGDLILCKSRRYAHSADYIRRMAKLHGFTELSMQNAVLRTEKESPVAGKVVVLRSRQ